MFFDNRGFQLMQAGSALHGMVVSFKPEVVEGSIVNGWCWWWERNRLRSTLLMLVQYVHGGRRDPWTTAYHHVHISIRKNALSSIWDSAFSRDDIIHEHNFGSIILGLHPLYPVFLRLTTIISLRRRESVMPEPCCNFFYKVLLSVN